MTLTAELKEVFETTDLYEVLGLEKNVEQARIKSAYYKASLKWHPDRVSHGDKDDVR